MATAALLLNMIMVRREVGERSFKPGARCADAISTPSLCAHLLQAATCGWPRRPWHRNITDSQQSKVSCKPTNKMGNGDVFVALLYSTLALALALRLWQCIRYITTPTLLT